MKVLMPGRPGLLLAVVALLLLAAVPGVLRIGIDADIGRLLPRASEASEGLALVLEGFADRSTVYVLLEAVDEPPPDLEGAAADLADDLRELDGVQEVIVGAEPVAADPRLVVDLADEPLLAALADRVSPDGLDRRAAALKRMLSGPTTPQVRQLLLDDPLGLTEMLGRRIARGSGRVGGERAGFVSADGAAALVVVRPHDPGDMAGREALLGRIAAAAGHIEGVGVRTTGAWAHASSIARATRRDASRLSAVSVLVVLLLYVVFYRSGASLLLAGGVLTAAAWLTLGLGGLLFGRLTPVAAGALAMIFGLGIDPAIHLLARVREARATSPPAEAVATAVRGVGPAVIAAAGTTALALFGVALADPGALGQLGVLAGTGVVLCAALVLTALPAACLLLGERLAPDPGFGAGSARALGRALAARPVAVLAVAGLFVALIAGLGLTRVRYAADLGAFEPDHLAPMQVDAALRARFGEPTDPLLVVITGAEDEAVLRANEAWTDALAGLRPNSGAAVLPSAASAAARRARVAEMDLPGAAAGLRSALLAQGFVAAPFDAGLSRLSVLEGAAEVPGWLAWMREQHVADVHGASRAVVRLAPQDPRTLPTPPATPGVRALITSRALVEADAAAGMQRTLPRLLGLAALLLLAVLGLRYRRPLPVLVTAGPLVVSVALYLGLHGLAGWAISPFVVAAVPLLIGVGIDDHLFVLDRYLESTGPDPLGDALAGAGRAVAVTTVTTLAAFGVLAFSEFGALAELGRSVALALGLAFVSSVVVMPSLLSLLPLRRST